MTDVSCVCVRISISLPWSSSFNCRWKDDCAIDVWKSNFNLHIHIWTCWVWETNSYRMCLDQCTGTIRVNAFFFSFFSHQMGVDSRFYVIEQQAIKWHKKTTKKKKKRRVFLFERNEKWLGIDRCCRALRRSRDI